MFVCPVHVAEARLLAPKSEEGGARASAKTSEKHGFDGVDQDTRGYPTPERASHYQTEGAQEEQNRLGLPQWYVGRSISLTVLPRCEDHIIYLPNVAMRNYKESRVFKSFEDNAAQELQPALTGPRNLVLI